jgi:hypothetical protein
MIALSVYRSSIGKLELEKSWNSVLIPDVETNTARSGGLLLPWILIFSPT